MTRINECLKTAEALARQHVFKQGPVGPDEDAWLELLDNWVRRGSKRFVGLSVSPEDWKAEDWRADTWTPTEMRCIQAAGAASLGYERLLANNRRRYVLPANQRGLWAGGDTFRTDEQREAA